VEICLRQCGCGECGVSTDVLILSSKFVQRSLVSWKGTLWNHITCTSSTIFVIQDFLWRNASVCRTPFFMTPGGIVFVLNFPPDSLWEKQHSCFPNDGDDGYFNDTLRSLLKLVSGVSPTSCLPLRTNRAGKCMLVYMPTS